MSLLNLSTFCREGSLVKRYRVPTGNTEVLSSSPLPAGQAGDVIIIIIIIIIMIMITIMIMMMMIIVIIIT